MIQFLNQNSLNDRPNMMYSRPKSSFKGEGVEIRKLSRFVTSIFC